MKRLTPSLVLVAVLAASCASIPREAVKQCSDTPQNAISIFLQGIKEFSLTLLRAVIPEESSLYGVFGNNDERHGQEIVRQISAHPEVSGESGGCACTLLSMTNTADRNEKTVVVKRAVIVGDDVRDYKRSFRVRFEPNGNCILTVSPIDKKWEQIVDK